MHPDLYGSISPYGVHPQASRHYGTTYATVTWTRSGEAAGVLAYLVTHRQAGLIVIELNVLRKNGVGLGGVASLERGLKEGAVHPQKCVE